MRRPRVCMLLATDRLGGPGKGLVQFLRHGGLAGCSPVVVAYEAGEPGETEFTRAVRDTGADLRILRQRGAFDVSLIPQALRVVRDEGCEVLQSHGYKSHAVCACLHAMTGLPWVAFVHGWTAENVRVRAYRVLEQALLPLATRVVAVSDALGRSVWPAARRRMVVIPNAIDPAEALRDGDVPATGPHFGAHPDAFAQVPQVPGGASQPEAGDPGDARPDGGPAAGLYVSPDVNPDGSPDANPDANHDTGSDAGKGDLRAAFGIAADALVAGVVGRLSPEKGHIHFLRALARARQTEPRLVGLLAGDGPGADMLRREADMLGLAHAVTFAGHVSRVVRVYRALDVAVLPSLSEGMPNAALEAMLHGLPVVASHVGGVPEVVRDGETGLLVPPGDETQLAAALVALCADVERRKALGARGRERVLGHFAPHQRAERILGLYHELLQPLAGEGQRHAKLG